MYETPDLKDTEMIPGSYDDEKDWVYDLEGYFLIRVNKEENRIEAGYCKQSNKILKLIHGKRGRDVYFTICELKLISRLDHAAYLGRELEKAELALKNNLNYVQDDDLAL
jgi:tetrahydromethanopterin S-methyltransferase subunit A